MTPHEPAIGCILPQLRVAFVVALIWKRLQPVVGRWPSTLTAASPCQQQALLSVALIWERLQPIAGSWSYYPAPARRCLDPGKTTAGRGAMAVVVRTLKHHTLRACRVACGFVFLDFLGKGGCGLTEGALRGTALVSLGAGGWAYKPPLVVW